MPSKKKKYNARFPPARIKKIMQTDEDVGKVAAAVPVIISRSLELFIDSLIERTATITRAKNAKTLSTSHIKQAIYSEKTFDFLRDLAKNIPDHQVDEEGDSVIPSGSGPPEKKPKPAKPRKPREEGARGRGRPRKVKPEPEVKKESSSEEEDDEETESDEEHLSQEETGVTDQDSNSSASTSLPSAPMPTFTAPQSFQSRLAPPQNTIVSTEQLNNDQFCEPVMAQRQFQQQPTFPMHPFPFPPYGIPPGVSPLGPPQFLPAVSPNVSSHQQQVPQGMFHYPPFVPPFPVQSDGQGPVPCVAQNIPYITPGLTACHSNSGPTGQHRPSVGNVEQTNHLDSNMPLDMSMTGKSRFHSDTSSQGTTTTDSPVKLTTLPVPKSLPALIPQGYQGQPHQSPLVAPPGQLNQHVLSQPYYQTTTGYDGNQHTTGYDSNQHNTGYDGNKSNTSFDNKQPNIEYDNSLQRRGFDSHQTNKNFESTLKSNKAISNNTDNEQQEHLDLSMPRKVNNSAVTPGDTTLRNPGGEEKKDKGLVSFPGLSSIMKINASKPVNNNDDDDYDT